MSGIEDNSIIVVHSYLKNRALLELGKHLKRTTVITFESLVDNLLFSFDEKAIYHLMSNYNLKYEVALMYLNNLVFIEDKEYSFKKLNELNQLKKHLDENSLLVYSPHFKNKLKRNKVIFYEIPENKFNQRIIEQVKSLTDVQIVNGVYDKDYSHTIYEFSDINSELEFVAEQICELINNGVDITNITLLNVGTDYIIPLKRVFELFNIPVNINNKNSILSTEMVRFFLNHIESDINITLSKISEEFDLNKEGNLAIYNQIVDICNKYLWVENYVSIKDLLIHDFMNSKVEEPKISNAVTIQKFEEYQPSDKDYVFVVGFNQGVLPILERDEEYLNDELKEVLNLDTTVEKNDIHRKMCLRVMQNTKNMWISYNKSEDKQLSTINSVLNYQVIKKDSEYKYSHLNNKLTLGKYLDNYLKYGSKNDTLTNLYSNYKNIQYRTFDNSFKGLDRKNEPLTLSYSSIDTYYKCSFRYYISSILKLNIYEENFANYLGSLFHFCLSKRRECTLEESWDLFLENNKKEFSNKDKFFLSKGMEELKFIFDVLDKQSEHTTFHDEEYETKIEVDVSNDTKFVGIIDKVMFDNERKLGAIVDYKTGNPELKLNNIIHGLNLQLPIYLYLIKNKYPDMEVVGFYLQKILPSLILKDKTKSLDTQRKELLKLQGYSLSDEEKLSKFDKTYVDSDLIKSLKVGNNGFYAYSKTLTSREMNQIIDIINDKINFAVENIKNNNFAINPKYIDNENVGCAFCKFKDICYMNNKDLVYLEEEKDLSFLGGDNNA